jgi:hypothetical protein
MLSELKLSQKRARKNAKRKTVRASRLLRKINDEALRLKLGMPFRFRVGR